MTNEIKVWRFARPQHYKFAREGRKTNHDAVIFKYGERKNTMKTLHRWSLFTETISYTLSSEGQSILS